MENNLNLHGVTEHMLSVLDNEYRGQLSSGNLPHVKNRHEAYGIAAERYVAVTEAGATLKRAMADALKVLPNSEDDFFSTCEVVYDACVGVASSAALMAVQMQNIIHQLAPYENQYAGTTPLEAMAEGSLVESADDNPIDDEEE